MRSLLFLGFKKTLSVESIALESNIIRVWIINKMNQCKLPLMRLFSNSCYNFFIKSDIG